MTNQNASPAMSAGGRRIQSRVHSRIHGAAAGAFRFDGPSERAQEPTSESLTADVSQAAAGYATDRQFRVWFKEATRRTERLRKAIEERSLRLITDVPSPSLRKAVDRYLRSPHVQLFHLHREWMSKKGALSEQPTLLRQARFYSLWRAREDGGAMPWELDPSKRCHERFEMRGKRKRGGYQVGGAQVLRESWRTFFAFGIACGTWQKKLSTQRLKHRPANSTARSSCSPMAAVSRQLTRSSPQSTRTRA